MMLDEERLLMLETIDEEQLMADKVLETKRNAML